MKENAPDRISDLLEEAAKELEHLEERIRRKDLLIAAMKGDDDEFKRG